MTSLGTSSTTLTIRRGKALQAFGHQGVLRRLDWIMVGCALALSVIGAVLVWSATRYNTALNGGNSRFFLERHLMNLAIGVGLGIAALFMDARRLRAYAPVIYAVSCLGLLAVLSPLGSTINGAHSWIVLGAGFSIQPSEFAKIGITVGAAAILSRRMRDEQEGPERRDILLALLVAAVPMGIIVLLPDLGSTMVLVAVTAGVLVISGVSRWWLLGMLVVAGLLVFAVVEFHLLSQYQVNRFAAFADPKLDPAGVGYNTQQARIAIGSGGLTGQGLFHGAQTNGQYVPEQQTDFIFTVAGEELGFVGGAAIIALFIVLMWRCYRVAQRCEGLFGTIVASGIIAWFGFETFENIGMTLGIMPVAGIPLPFVSYGGSSMFANWIAIGLLQGLNLRRPRHPPTPTLAPGERITPRAREVTLPKELR